MTRRLVPTIFYKVGDSFLEPSGSILRIVGIDAAQQTYDLRGRYSFDVKGVPQDVLWSRVKYGNIKYLGKGTEE